MAAPDPTCRRAEAQRRAATGASAAMVVAAAGAVGLALVYWLGGQPQLEGALLLVGLVALGAGLALASHAIGPRGPFVERRSPLATTERERRSAAAAAGRQGLVTRRRLLTRSFGLAAGAFAVAAVFPLRSLGPRPGRALLETGWGAGVRAVAADGRRLRADAIPDDSVLTAFPEGHPGAADGQVVVVRVEPSRLALGPGRQNWAPQGIVAFSKVCTHAGCPVGLYTPENHTLLCPCHQSSFDVLRGAEPIRGPAAWPLPQLPLAVDDEGYLVATGELSAPAGPGWWRVS